MSNPVEIFKHHWQEARLKQDPNADVCFLATASRDNGASVRTLVLRDVTETAFVIFVNSSSPKWDELMSSNSCELLVFWPLLMQQYRVRGEIKQIPEVIMKKQWQNKPYETKLLDHVYAEGLPQSSAIDSKDTLVNKIDKLKQKYSEPGDVPFVGNAKGIEIVISSIEIWIGSEEDRLHHRTLYRVDGDGWQKESLIP